MTKTFILFVSVLLLSLTSSKHTCVHDEMFKDYVIPGSSKNSMLNEDGSRLLGMSDLKTNYEPLRVKFITNELGDGISGDEAIVAYIKDKLIPIAEDYF
mmetsp:Transcript_44917/g.68690  ORF Transcript_44917/g.68690 Transcript_44917/m.68690 type:complete len:99 (-) Transcript_44917:1750-2046(-)